MKKRIFVCLMSLIGLLGSVNAQEWRVIENDADELLGTDASTWLMYSVEDVGSFTILDVDKLQFLLVTDSGFFHYYKHDDGHHQGMNVLVGIYYDDVLVDKFEMWLDIVPNSGGRILRTRNGGTLTNPRDQNKNVKRIINTLMDENGNVRFVAKRYSRDLFDLFVLSMKSEE